MLIANFPSKRLGDVEVLLRWWSNKIVLGADRSVDLNCTPAFLRLRVILDIIATLRNKIILVDVLEAIKIPHRYSVESIVSVEVKRAGNGN